MFEPGGWVPMREYGEEEVDFVIVGTGAGGGTLACKLAGSRTTLEVGPGRPISVVHGTHGWLLERAAGAWLVVVVWWNVTGSADA